MDITFSHSPVVSSGTAAVCSECGAVITDWLFGRDGARTLDRPNQDKHKLWHEKIINDIAVVALRALGEEPS